MFWLPVFNSRAKRLNRIEHLLETLVNLAIVNNQEIRKMALDFTAFDADFASVKSEIGTLISLYQSSQQAITDKAADIAALAQRDADLKALRDQLAAITAPPAVQTPAPAPAKPAAADPQTNH